MKAPIDQKHISLQLNYILTMQF